MISALTTHNEPISFNIIVDNVILCKKLIGLDYVLLKFECPSTKLNAKMRKILKMVHILNIVLLIN